ncbi:hypothetical protein AB0I51_05480 [Streptomyces sp. NPDC050549]|uniref:hypothetical protein n=1 Tax=Streptomyces sp. NPDC050549 TaxID=3155406 RepID=UPI003447E801
MDQPTREQLLHAEAARHGIAPDTIDRAVSVIAAVQRRDRADFRRNFGGELTPDRWLAAYGVSGFKDLCAHAAHQAGLDHRSDSGDVILRIVSAIAPVPKQHDDDRPVQFWARPLTSPGEASFSAYRVTYESPDEMLLGFDWSSALLRSHLHGALHRGGGAASLEEGTGVIVFTYARVRGAYVARPAPSRSQPSCHRCGQWEPEHRMGERFGACGQFTPTTTSVASQLTAVSAP